MGPLLYVMSLSLAVACYNAAADVSPFPSSWAVGCPALHAPAPWLCCSVRPARSPVLPPARLVANCAWLWTPSRTHSHSIPTPTPHTSTTTQAGMMPVFPELKLATNAPFGLTSFALSLLLVFR